MSGTTILFDTRPSPLPKLLVVDKLDNNNLLITVTDHVVKQHSLCPVVNMFTNNNGEFLFEVCDFNGADSRRVG